MLFFQQFTELRHTGGFTRTLQTGHQHHSRRLGGEIQGVVFLAHRRNQFALNDFDELLPRRQAFVHLMADCTLFDAADEIPYHRQGNIGFQKRHTHFAQRFFNIVFRQSSATTDIAQGARKSVS